MPKLSENTEVALPLRNIISMVAAASLATWAYFGLIESKHTRNQSDYDAGRLRTERVSCEVASWRDETTC